MTVKSTLEEVRETSTRWYIVCDKESRLTGKLVPTPSRYVKFIYFLSGRSLFTSTFFKFFLVSYEKNLLVLNLWNPF